METTRDSSPDATADKAEEILNRRGADGERIYDNVKRDPKTGGWMARQHRDHTKIDRVA